MAVSCRCFLAALGSAGLCDSSRLPRCPRRGRYPGGRLGGRGGGTFPLAGRGGLVGGEEATTFANLRFIELQFVSQKSVKRQHLHVSADVAGSRLL